MEDHDQDRRASPAEPSLLVLERRRGRPKADEPLSPLTIWVPTRTYDRINLVANEHRVSMSGLVRTLLQWWAKSD